MVTRTVTDPEHPRHARPRRREVRPRRRARSSAQRRAWRAATACVDGKSILGILLLAAARGIAITITADGSDETEALEALCRWWTPGSVRSRACA